MNKTCLKEDFSAIKKTPKTQTILPLSSTTLVCSLKQSTGKPIISTSTNGSMIWKTESSKYGKVSDKEEIQAHGFYNMAITRY